MKTLNEYISTQSDNVILEMARVGWMGVGKDTQKYEIYIHTDDPGNIPHIHLRDYSTRGHEFETCISLVSAEYFLHGKYSDKMNNSLAKTFDNFMRAPSRNKKYNTNFEYAIDMWNDNNSSTNIEAQFDDNGNIIIPDYTNINNS